MSTLSSAADAGRFLTPEICCQLLEALGDRLVLVDQDFVVRWCNEAFAHLARKADAEVCGQFLLDLVSGDHVGALRAAAQQALAGVVQKVPQLCLDFPQSGATGWFSMQARPLVNPLGGAGYGLIQLRDSPVSTDTAFLFRETPAENGPAGSAGQSGAMSLPGNLAGEAGPLVNQLALLLDAARDTILLLDVHGRVLIANRTAAERVGVAPQDMLGRHIGDFLPPEVAKLRYQWGERALSTGTSVFFEDQRAGRWVENRFIPIAGPNGRPGYLACFSRDITERKKAEADRDQVVAELLEFQSRLRAVLEGAGESIFLLDTSGRILLANPIGAKRLRQEIHQTVGQPIAELLPPETGRAFRALLAEAVLTGEAASLEGEFGGLFYETSFYPVQGPGGEVSHVAVFGRDITPRKRMEQQLEQNQRQLQTLLDHAPIFLWAMDAEGVVTKAEGSVLAMLKWTPRQVVGASLFALLEGQADFCACCRRALAGERVFLRHEWQCLVFDTRMVPLHNADGQVNGVIGVMLDVTARVQAERQLLHRLEFESTLLAISSRFVGPFNLDVAVQQSLEDLGRFSQASRAYLILLSEDGRYLTNTHEWCAPGVSSERHNLQRLPVAQVQWGMDLLRASGVVHIPEVDRMPPEARRDQELLRSQNITSIVLVSVLVAGKMRGFIGFDDVTGLQRWGEEQEGLLRLFSEVLSHVLERHDAEAALRASENFNRAIVEAAASGLAVYDRDHLCRLWNPYLERMTGIQAPEALGQSLATLVCIGAEESLERLLQRALQGHTIEGQDGPFLVPGTGRRGWHHATYSPLRSGAGAITGVLCSVLDITQRKLAEEELRRSEERFSRAFNLSPVLMLVTRLQDGMIVNANEFFLHSLGLEREAVVGKTTVELNLYEDPAQRARMIEPLRRGEVVRNLEIGVRSAKGRMDCLMSAAVVDLGGEPHLLSLALDITARKAAEDQLRQTSRQLRALAERIETVREEERRQIAREIHDDLGQCLTSLKLDLVWLARHLASDAGVLRERLEDMTKVVDQSLQSVRRLSSELRPGVLDDLGLPAAVEWQTQEFERRTGMACSLHCDSGLDELEPQRATALFRILQEALTNIIRHAAASRVRVRLLHEGPHVVLEVRDNGKGLPPKEASRSGGLGLVSMRERAAALGGSFRITSRRGRGTTLEARLPLPARPAPPASAP